MCARGLKPVVGPWAAEDSFFDREDEVTDMLLRIRRGASISLAAPRRVGKTSLLQRVRRQLDPEMTCIFVDLEGSATPEDAITEIASQAAAHQALKEKAVDWARWLLGHTEFDFQVGTADLRDAVRVDWQERGTRLISALCRDNYRVVLFLDELPILVASLLALSAAEGRNQADRFLSWLRKTIQAHQGKLSVVLTGSIGLGPMVDRAGLSATLNIYEPMRLDPWSRETTLAALRALSLYESLELSDEVAGAIYDLLGVGVPYHVQLVHQAVAEDARRRPRRPVTADDVRRVWQDNVLRNPSADLPHWEQRLRGALARPEYDLAVRLLTDTALSEPLLATRAQEIAREPPEDAHARDTLRVVLATLEHDGYLARNDRGWYFPNRLLRAWWEGRYGPLHPGARPR